MKKYIFIVALFFVIIIALFVRLYRFNELTWFWSDQAIDLLVVRNFILRGQWPLIGPYLTVEHFTLPPAYYYILSTFLYFGKTPEGTALFFTAMDMFGMFLLYALVQRLTDKWTGVIAMALYASSYVMISHARSMWQPHPVQVFLIASLLTLTIAQQKKSPKWQFASTFLYAIATGIYPSPILLLPYFVYRGATFHRSIQPMRFGMHWVKSIVQIIFCFFIISIPLFWYQMKQGWSMALVTTSQSFQLPRVSEAIHAFSSNVFGFMLSVTWFSVHNQARYILPIFTVLILVFIAIVCVLFHRSIASSYRKNLKSFFSFPALFIGFLAMVFYRDFSGVDWPWYRLYGFLPFFFVAFAYVIRFAKWYQNVWYRMLIAVLVSGYFVINLTHVFDMVRGARPPGEVQKERQITTKLHDEFARRSLRREDVTIIGSGSQLNWNSYILPQLYLMWEMYGWETNFHPFGTYVIYDVEYDFRNYVMVICKNVSMTAAGNTTCGTYYKHNLVLYDFIGSKTLYDHVYLYIFRKKTAQP